MKKRTKKILEINFYFISAVLALYVTAVYDIHQIIFLSSFFTILWLHALMIALIELREMAKENKK